MEVCKCSCNPYCGCECHKPSPPDTWEEEFGRLFDAQKLYKNPNASISELKDFIRSLLASSRQQERRAVLKNYTKWLFDNGYVDSDVYDEGSALDRYLTE